MNSIYEALSEIATTHQPVALCTIVKTSGSSPRHSTSKMLVYPDGHILGTVGGGELENRIRKEALACLQDEKPRLLSYKMTDPSRGDAGVCGGQVEIFVEPILPAPMVVVLGGGHVGKAVAHLAKWLGFRVAVSDDRPEFCTAESNPDANEFYPVPMAELPLHMNITRQTALVLTTRGNNVDIAGLPSLLESQAGYIGVIGSHKRWSETVKSLTEAGVSDEQLKRIHSPIGLGIGAETPEEIAVSIMAEVLMLRSGGSEDANAGTEMTLSPNQRMFHGGIRSAALADQLSARFNDRQHRVSTQVRGDTALVQIGSMHGTPVTLHITDTEGGVLVTMSRDRDWLDRVADASDILEHALV